MRPDDQAVRRGPRHAAPRRSLLGRVPAGKAIALAAMPTAVFLGLGLTPRPAIAEDDPADRWRPGPCAEQSEEPKGEEPADAGDEPADRDGEEAPGAGESAAPGGGASPSPSATDGGSAAERPGGGGDGSGSGSGGASGGGPDGGGAGESGEAEPSPSPSESRPWYDPLGLGDTLDGLLGPDDPEAEPEPGTEPSGGSGGADSAGSGSGSGSDGGKESGSGAASDEEQREKEKAVRDAAEEAGATVEELDDKVRETAEDPADEKPDAGAGAAADGKEPFPCPTADPEALANAALEPGLPLLPDDPWRLDSTKLTLKGLKYHGIVEVKTYSGQVKKVLKYTADDGVDIRDLHQTVVGPGRNTTHVRADEGSTSTIRNGTVTMYTEELKGNLFGLIPLTFSPESPPPLDLPFAFFTDVRVVQAGQFGGTLTVPGLQNTIE